MMWKSFGLLMVFVFMVYTLSGQQTIKGQVIDALQKEPLIGASISLKNGEGTITDLEGHFELTTTGSEFSVSYVGFATRTVQVGVADTSMIIELIPNDENLPPVIILCDCSGPSYKTPTHIAELKKIDLQVNNETIITPSLNRIPGVFMHSGSLNTNRITIRGIGNRSPFATAKIKAYLDNIPLTNGSGETTIEDIDLSLVDQVNVFKGPTSSIYGAGLGGMIYLKTGELYNPQTSLSTQNTFGSYGLIRNTLQFNHSKDSNNQLMIGVNNTLSEGYRENNRYGRNGFTAISKFKLSKNEEITIIGNYVDLFARIPSSLDSTDFKDNPTKAAFTWARAKGYESTKKILAGGSYAARIGAHFSQNSSIFTTIRRSYENRPFNILRERAFARGLRTEWTYQNSFSEENNQLEIRLGTELFTEDYDWQTNDTNGIGDVGNLLTDKDENRSYANVFTQIKLDIKNNLAITGGLNVNYTDYHVFDFQNPENYNREFPLIWSPSLSVGYNLLDGVQQISLHGLVSHGFSPPTLEETLNPEGTINPEILPEQGWNFEIGSRGSLFNNFKYSLSLYSMRIRDLLVARRTALDQYVGINAGKTVHNGLELELSHYFQARFMNFRPYLNYTYADYRFEEFMDDENDFSGNELTGTAPHQLNAGLTFNSGYPGFYGNLFYQFVDAMPMRDDNAVYSEAYHLINFKYGYQFIFGDRWQLDIFAGINNLWNEKYASMLLINAASFGGNDPRYYYPGLPRNFYAGFKASVDFR